MINRLMRLSRTHKKRLYESVMRTLSKHVYRMLSEKLTSSVVPSVQRWLDDQINMNNPDSIEEIRRYLFAKDPGTYGLCTERSELIMQSFCNSYIADNVPWFGTYRLLFAVSKTGNLAAIDCHYGSVRLVIGSQRYDFALSFTENLGKLCKKVSDLLASLDSLDEYRKMGLKIVRTAQKGGIKQAKFSI